MSKRSDKRKDPNQTAYDVVAKATMENVAKKAKKSRRNRPKTKGRS